jgi:hypothetical protein
METRGFTCRDGWHVVARAGELTYVRVAIRLRDQYGTYVYRVGVVPDDAACGTIWCYGDEGKPWACTACGNSISARIHNQLRPTRRRSWKMALVEPFLFFVDPDGQLDRRTRQRHATLAMRAYYARIEQSEATDDGRDDRPS